MARILADKDIKKLLGTVIVGAVEECLNPNGIELRMGKHVHFHSTAEEGTLEEESFLKVHSGEAVTISSLEKIDFTAETVGKVSPHKMLMGLVTPTTTMMREGISQVTTKIDAGFRGILNWGLRNDSSKDLIIGYGEPIFKLTIFALDDDERPELAYGERDGDKYMDSERIKDSTRTIPAQIPKTKILSSRFGKIDPKEQLREAGYPFDYISAELIQLGSKLEIVSTTSNKFIDELSSKIDELLKKIGDVIERQGTLQIDSHYYMVAQSLGTPTDNMPLPRLVPVRVFTSGHNKGRILDIVGNIQQVLNEFGFDFADEFPEELGSWFKKWFARSRELLSRPEVATKLKNIERALELSGIHKPQAEINKAEAEAVAVLLNSIAAEPNVLIQIGSLLMVKSTNSKEEASIEVRSLSQEELIQLEQNQPFIKNLDEILKFQQNNITKIAGGVDAGTSQLKSGK